MNDQYLEEGIKCRDTSKNKGIRLGLIVLVLFTFFLVLINPALIISPVVAIALAVFIFSRLKIEYEYIYADGQIDFDRISGNAKRKTLMRVDIENAEVIAPTSSDSIKAYNNNNRIKVKDFRSVNYAKQNRHNRIIESCDDQSRHKPRIKNESDRKNRVHKNGKPQIRDD